MNNRYWAVKDAIRSIENGSISRSRLSALQVKLMVMQRLLLRYPPTVEPQQPTHFDDFFSGMKELHSDGGNPSLYDNLLNSADMLIARMEEETKALDDRA